MVFLNINRDSLLSSRGDKQETKKTVFPSQTEPQIFTEKPFYIMTNRIIKAIM